MLEMAHWRPHRDRPTVGGPALDECMIGSIAAGCRRRPEPC